jgi:hypothetical protein
MRIGFAKEDSWPEVQALMLETQLRFLSQGTSAERAQWLAIHADSERLRQLIRDNKTLLALDELQLPAATVMLDSKTETLRHCYLGTDSKLQTLMLQAALNLAEEEQWKECSLAVYPEGDQLVQVLRSFGFVKEEELLSPYFSGLVLWQYRVELGF